MQPVNILADHTCDLALLDQLRYGLQAKSAVRIALYVTQLHESHLSQIMQPSESS